MGKTVFHSSIEGAQHGGKTLEEFVSFGKKSWCSWCRTIKLSC